MDLEKLTKFAIDTLSEYFYVSAITLSRPVSRFAPVPTATSEGIYSPRNIRLGPRLNPKLFGFLAVSIVLGATINALIPHRLKPPELLTSVILGIVSWVTYGVLIHGLCKLLRGNGSLIDTLSVTLQLFGVLYVVSSFLGVVFGTVSQVPFVNDLLIKGGHYTWKFAEKPVLFYFVIHAILLCIYLPIALRKVHEFGWVKQLVLVLPAVIVMVFISLAIYKSTGSLDTMIALSLMKLDA